MSDLTPSHSSDPDDHPRGEVSEPIPDPGLPEHQPRPTDVDPVLEKRAERQVAGMFGAATLLALAFCVCYFAIDPQTTVFGFGALNVALGGTLGLALLLIGIGAIQWARKLMTDHEIIEYRHPAVSSDEDREIALAAFRTGAAESGFGRRTMIRNSLLGALGVLGLPAIVLLRDLGPLPGDSLEHTVWRRGMRIVNDVAGTPIKPADVELGQLINAEPAVFFPQELPNGRVIPPLYEGTELNDQKAKAAVILVRMQPSDIHPTRRRRTGATTASSATPRSAPTSVARSASGSSRPTTCCARATSPPSISHRAASSSSARPPGHCRSCPSGSTAEGYLIAMHDFNEPVGPSFWEEGAMIDACRRLPAKVAGRSRGSTSAWDWPAWPRSSCARCSPTTGPSCWARSRCGAS